MDFFSVFAKCCRGSHLEECHHEHRVELLAADSTAAIDRHSLHEPDAYDITFTPREANTIEPWLNTLTPRQLQIRTSVELPNIVSNDAPEKRKALLEAYRNFVVNLHRGAYYSQLTASCEYSEIHVQLMDDLQTLKLDQSNGRIIEFPLVSVSKVYRVVRSVEVASSPHSGAFGFQWSLLDPVVA